MNCSVIICTHNPRIAYLTRVLEALKSQTLPTAQWELLLIDNASHEDLALKWDLSWHPQGRHVREDRMGLTYARARGFRESSGEILVLVDDDVVVGDKSLRRILETCLREPNTGGGGGVIDGEPESGVAWPSWLDERLRLFIAVRQVAVLGERCVYYPACDDYRYVPPGAFVWYRKSTLVEWARAVENGRKSPLDRKGKSLWSSGDMEMNHAVLDRGLSLKYDPDLKARHLIPQARLNPIYFSTLLYWIGRSSQRLENRMRTPAWLERIVRFFQETRSRPVGCWRAFCRILSGEAPRLVSWDRLSDEDRKACLYDLIGLGRSDERFFQNLVPWQL